MNQNKILPRDPWWLRRSDWKPEVPADQNDDGVKLRIAQLVKKHRNGNDID